MTELEQRVAALETRVEQLAVETGHASNLAVTASREALTAREAHQRNIELLNALRQTQAEHSRTLSEHGRLLSGHSGRLHAIDAKLGQLTLGMHTIESLLRRLVDE